MSTLHLCGLWHFNCWAISPAPVFEDIAKGFVCLFGPGFMFWISWTALKVSCQVEKWQKMALNKNGCFWLWLHSPYTSSVQCTAGRKDSGCCAGQFKTKNKQQKQQSVFLLTN